MFSLDDVRSPYCLYCLSRSVVISILSIVHTLSEYCLYVPKIENPPKVQPSIHRHSSIQHTAYLFQHVFHYPATMEYTILPYTTSTRLYSSLLYSTTCYSTPYSGWISSEHCLTWRLAHVGMWMLRVRIFSLYLVELFERGGCPR